MGLCLLRDRAKRGPGLGAVLWLVPNSADRARHRLDYIGASLSVVALVGTVAAVIEGPEIGWLNLGLDSGYAMILAAVFTMALGMALLMPPTTNAIVTSLPQIVGLWTAGRIGSRSGHCSHHTEPADDGRGGRRAVHRPGP